MAEWKKVVVSGSQAELNSLDLKGSSGNLVVEGNSTLGNAATDFARITGSADISGSLNVVGGSGVFRNRVFIGDNFTGNPSIAHALSVESSGSSFAAKIANGSNAVGSTGGGLYLQGGQYQVNPAITHFTYNGSNTFKVETSGNITSLGDLSIAGSTTLGNQQSDKVNVTGSLFVSASKNIFTGDVTASRVYIEGGGVENTKDLFLKNGEAEFILNNNGAAFQIKKQSDNSKFLRIGLNRFNILEDGLAGEGFKIGPTANLGGALISLDATVGTSGSLKVGQSHNNTDLGLSVTGSTDISGSLRVDGTLTVTGDTLQEDLRTTGITRLGNDMGDKTEITGSLNVTGSSVFSGENAKITIDPDSTSAVIDVLDVGGGTLELIKMRDVAGGDQIRIRRNGGQNSLELLDNGANSILLDSKNNGFYLNNFAIGASSADANNTLSVTGNIKTTTGITGSYLTNNNILVAGSAGEVESSGVTWDGSTLDLGAGNITSTGDLTIADARISGDLVVAGTASFENTENLKVTDRFISLASGSTGAGDGGIVIQQAASGLGEVFGFDNANGGRWGLRASFDPTASLFTPTDFMVTTTKDTSDPSADPTYGGSTGHGNMHVNTSTGDIFIYA